MPISKRITAAVFSVSMVLPMTTGLMMFSSAAADDAIVKAIVPSNTVVVTNTNDEGEGSLRHAVESASSGDIITFNIPNEGEEKEIILGSTLETGSKTLTFDGSTQGAKVTLKVNGAFRHISADVDLTLKGLTFDGDGIGGGINATSTVTATDCIFTENSAEQYGGGIYAFSSVTATDCTFTRNSAEQNGGGIYTFMTNVTVTQPVLKIY